MHLFKNIISTVLLLTISSFICAQVSYVKILNVDGELLKSYNTKKDTLEIYNNLNHEVIKLHKQGFLTASIDSLYFANDTVISILYKGETFSWAKIGKSNISPSLLRKIGFNEQKLSGKTLDPQGLFAVEEKIIEVRIISWLSVC